MGTRLRKSGGGYEEKTLALRPVAGLKLADEVSRDFDPTASEDDAEPR